MSKLTKTIVEAAPKKDKQYILWCGQLKGFGAYIHPTGRISYVVDYTTQGNKRSRMTIGRHGAITTEQARKMAIIVLGSSIQGDDPLLERRTKRQALTISELTDQYFEASKSGLILGRGGRLKKDSTIQIDTGYAKCHIIPLLGKRRVIDLRQNDVVKFIRDVTAGKTARTRPSEKKRGISKVTGGPAAATRSAALLGAMMSYALSEGVIEFNPVHGVKKPASKPRVRRLSPEEFQALGKTLNQAHDDLKPWQGIAIIRLAAFTGCRIGELIKLQWSEIDVEAKILSLKDTKTGPSTRPLPDPAIAILSAIEPQEGNPYVFTSPRLPNSHYGGTTRFYRWLFKEAGLEGVTPHVLRHSFASVGADLGFTDSTIGVCLGHSGSGITSRYTHRLDSVLIAAANKIAGEIAGQMKKKICNNRVRSIPD